MANQTINKTKNIVYVAKGFATGIIDLTLSVRKPDGSLLTPNPIITEQGLGVYTASYTPDVVGNWQEQITTVTNQDYKIRAYDVVSYDTDDIHTQVDGVKTKIDTIDSKVDNIANTVSLGGYFA